MRGDDIDGETRFALTEPQYLAANRAHVMLLFATGTAWTCPGVAGLAWGVLSLAGHSGDEPLPILIAKGLAGAIAIAVAVWLFLFVLSLTSLSARSRRLFAQQRAAREDKVIRWNTDGISFDGELATARFAWHDFIRWADSGDALLLFPNDVQFCALPREVVTAEQAGAIVDHLKANAVPQWRRWRALRWPTRAPIAGSEASS